MKVCLTMIKNLCQIQILPLNSFNHISILSMPLLHMFLKLYIRKLEIHVAILKWFKFFKGKYDVFLVNFGLYLFKIAMPLRADIIVVNKRNSYIILLPPVSNYM